MKPFFVEVHRDIDLVYFVNTKTSQIEGVYNIKKINFELLKKDGIKIKEAS